MLCGTDGKWRQVAQSCSFPISWVDCFTHSDLTPGLCYPCLFGDTCIFNEDQWIGDYRVMSCSSLLDCVLWWGSSSCPSSHHSFCTAAFFFSSVLYYMLISLSGQYCTEKVLFMCQLIIFFSPYRPVWKAAVLQLNKWVCMWSHEQQELWRALVSLLISGWWLRTKFWIAEGWEVTGLSVVVLSVNVGQYVPQNNTFFDSTMREHMWLD